MLEKARVPNSTKIRTWYNQLLNSLKHKGLSEEDITDTGIVKVIRQFDKEENLINSYDEDTVNNALLINTINDGGKAEPEDDGNEDSIVSDYKRKYFSSKVMSSEESDDSYLGLGSLQVKCSTKNKKLFEATIDNDWYISAKFNRAQLLALLYSCHELIENESHQPHNKECMSRIKQISHNNPNWTEKCFLNDLNY